MGKKSEGYNRERAKFYDEQMESTERGDISFYVERAKETDGPVLEVACGTGRVYLEALQQGVDIDGFDASEAALDILRDKALERDLEPSVWQGDMAEFETGREYDLVICPFNAIQHLLTVEEQLSALECIYDSLATDGRFIFDVFVPDFDIIYESYGEWVTEEITYRGEPREHRTRTKVEDEVAQLFTVANELTDPNGEKILESEHRLTLLPKREVELLARLSPFSEWQVTGDFEERPIRDGDSVQVWELRK